MDGSRVALVVANDLYADPGLRRLVAPAQDAAALAEVLADPSVGGFEVQVLQNESAQAIRFAVEDFFADRAPEDLLLLHFSCHGLKNAAGELFLAVADTKPTRLASTAVAADFVNRQMADSRAQRIALFLDCCYGGAFPRGMVVRAAGEAQVRDAFAGQEEVGGGRGRVVVTASSAMEYAFEGGQLATDASKPTPSVFTSAVVDGLTTGEADRDGDGWVGLTELVGYVSDRVRRVTPNQNPQMWTFGAQGELLIARSRVRRITPTPLAPELVEAMESPLTATRFGVVDYLRGRLHESDLGQAYAAWQALQRMLDDDSRRVSEAARHAIAEAVPRVRPAEVDLGRGDEQVELRLEGPPIALTAVATSETEWIRVEQQGEVVRLSAAPPGPVDHETTLLVAGPTGECVVPVRVRLADTEVRAPAPHQEPAHAPPEQAPQPKATPQLRHRQPAIVPVAERTRPPTQTPRPAQTPPAQTPPAQTPPGQPPPAEKVSEERAAPAASVPWWAVGVLIAGAVFLIYLNWPGAFESRKIWYDEANTGWHVYRSWSDPLILSSLVALVASLAARASGPLALGVVAGCAAFVAEDGVLILGGGISAYETRTWLLATAVAAVMAAVVLVVLRPKSLPVRPVSPLPAAMVVAGGILLLVSALIRHDDGISWFTVTELAALEPIVTVALAWLALAAVEAGARTWLSATAVTYALIDMVAVVPALTEGGSAPVFLTALIGNVLVVVGVISRGWRLPSRP